MLARVARAYYVGFLLVVWPFMVALHLGLAPGCGSACLVMTQSWTSLSSLLCPPARALENEEIFYSLFRMEHNLDVSRTLVILRVVWEWRSWGAKCHSDL